MGLLEFLAGTGQPQRPPSRRARQEPDDFSTFFDPAVVQSNPKSTTCGALQEWAQDYALEGDPVPSSSATQLQELRSCATTVVPAARSGHEPMLENSKAVDILRACELSRKSNHQLRSSTQPM